jgi:diamine N-acetyltransferase
MNNCKFLLIDKTKIGIIKPLWQKLNELHLKDSNYFKDHFKTFTFEKRCEIFNKYDDDKIRIEIITDDVTPVGYCISTIEGSKGEIDSLFIDENYRKNNYGRSLMQNSINWLNENNCERILLGVAEGHESVLGFYQKFGFYPRMTYLQMKKSTDLVKY